MDSCRAASYVAPPHVKPLFGLSSILVTRFIASCADGQKWEEACPDNAVRQHVLRAMLEGLFEEGGAKKIIKIQGDPYILENETDWCTRKVSLNDLIVTTRFDMEQEQAHFVNIGISSLTSHTICQALHLGDTGTLEMLKELVEKSDARIQLQYELGMHCKRGFHSTFEPTTQNQQAYDWFCKAAAQGRQCSISMSFNV